MVESETTTTGTGLNRLITFEVDPDETLLIRAGRDEMDNRTIYQGLASGRYAVVPVDELQHQAQAENEGDIDLDVEGLQIAGNTVTVPEKGAMTVGLHAGNRQVVRMDRPGAYGLLWIPGE